MMHVPVGSFVPARAALARPRGTDTSDSVAISTWGAATILVFGLHAGLYGLLIRRDAAEPPQPLEIPAAIMVNLSPVPVTAASQADNQAEGPPSTVADGAASAAPAPEEPPPPVPPVETVPAPPDVTPQAVLPTTPPTFEPPKPKPSKAEPRKPKKPSEKPSENPHREAAPVRTSKPREDARAAARNGGGPRSAEQTASRTASQSHGEAVSAAVRASWLSEIRSQIVRAKRFPSDAHGVTGVAVVSAGFTTAGATSGVRLVRSSGNGALDAEAVAVVTRAAPYPPPPDGRTTVLTIPLNFHR